MRNVRATRVLELNADHAAVQALQAAFKNGDKEKAKELAEILSTLSKLMAGVEIEDPADFTRKVSALF